MSDKQAKQDDLEKEMKEKARAAFNVGSKAAEKALPTFLSRGCMSMILFGLIMPIIAFGGGAITLIAINSFALGFILGLIINGVIGYKYIKGSFKAARDLVNKSLND